MSDYFGCFLLTKCFCILHVGLRANGTDAGCPCVEEYLWAFGQTQDWDLTTQLSSGRLGEGQVWVLTGSDTMMHGL